MDPKRRDIVLTQHHHMGVDESKAIHHDLALYRLNGINHNPNRPLVQLFKALLGVDVGA